MLEQAANESASALQIWGAIGFGALIGWYVYFINRYRKADVQFSDLVTLIGVIGGGAVLSLFPARSDLFGAYGIGLALGFFGYFIVLVILVAISHTTTKHFDVDWFLDGRRVWPVNDYQIPTETAATVHSMETSSTATGSK